MRILKLALALLLLTGPAGATQQIINVGSSPNDGTGDTLRTAFQKTNANFTELYARPIGGGGGTPGGSSGQLQYNNSGSFGGTAGWTFASGAIVNTQSIGAVSTDGLVLQNTTAAVLGAQQQSPRVRWTGQGWETNTSASQVVDWVAENQPIQGTANPSGNLVFSAQINAGGYNPAVRFTSGGQVDLFAGSQGAAMLRTSNGAVYLGNFLSGDTPSGNSAYFSGSNGGPFKIGTNNTDRISVDTSGNVSILTSGSVSAPSLIFGTDSAGWYRSASAQWTFATGGNSAWMSLLSGQVRFASTTVLGWNSTATDSTGSVNDTGVSRVNPAIVAIGNGAQGDASGTLSASSVQIATGGALKTPDIGVLIAESPAFHVAISPFNQVNVTISQNLGWLLQLGGITSAAPALKPNTGPLIQCRLADDSAYCSFDALSYSVSGTSVLSGQQTGYGTPTGGARQSSFAAGSITLPNLAAAVAQLILDLKAGKMPAT